MPASPSARSLKWLRDHGYVAQRVERWCPYSHRRIDLYGVIDIVGGSASQNGVLGVQSTSGSHVSDRLAKAAESDELKVWLAAGNGFVVHGWAKQGPAGKRKLWTLREAKLC
jgi:hypothetical protein